MISKSIGVRFVVFVPMYLHSYLYVDQKLSTLDRGRVKPFQMNLQDCKEERKKQSLDALLCFLGESCQMLDNLNFSVLLQVLV